jgi:hypothetical protein
MENAILAGDMTWHALPLHPYRIMDVELFRFVCRFLKSSTGVLENTHRRQVNRCARHTRGSFR